MSVKIDRHITKYRVEKPETEAQKVAARKADPGEFRKDGAKVVHLHERLERPEVLIGSTYKIKTPVSEHAMYVTINDIVLNQDTEHEKRQPFEVFINSKNLDQYQWIVALTRVISAVFRKGGDVSFLVDELRSVFDPKGGYWQPGGRFMPSIIAELGHVIEKHLHTSGVMPPPQLAPGVVDAIDAARVAWQQQAPQGMAAAGGQGIAGARLCPKCHNVAVVVLDGCSTCLECGDSKCG